MKPIRIILSLLAISLSAQTLQAEAVSRGRISLQSGETYSQDKSWEESKREKLLSPVKILHWIAKLTGHTTVVPTSSAFEPTYSAKYNRSDVALAITFKF